MDNKISDMPKTENGNGHESIKSTGADRSNRKKKKGKSSGEKTVLGTKDELLGGKTGSVPIIQIPPEKEGTVCSRLLTERNILPFTKAFENGSYLILSLVEGSKTYSSGSPKKGRARA
jgi:hypothetical protein